MGWRRVATVAVAVLAVSSLGVAAAIAATHDRATTRSATGTRGATPAPAASTTTTVPIVALVVRTVTPSPSSSAVSTASPIDITWSVPPAASSPAPVLSPTRPGRWTRNGVHWIFRPRAGWLPDTRVTVSVDPATLALEGPHRVTLAAPYRSTFTVGRGSVLRLQQLLGSLHYLPLAFERGGVPVSEPTRAVAVSTIPQRGQLVWAYDNIPPSLATQWSPGQPNEVTQGAVMAFEADHGLAVDGVAGPAVWHALVSAVAARQVDPRGYDYVEVTETSPETLTVWQSGNSDVYSSPVNTGARGAETQQGTFPVYLRYAAHAMVGTNPDGTKYNDPGIQWIAYFNGGDAIHGYPRAEYGYPQSNGCVELPIANAGAVWNSGEDWYGTLVNVT